MPRHFSSLLVFFVLFGLLAITGCSSKRAVQEPASEITSLPAPTSVDAQIAAFVGSGYEGATQTFASTRYGTATVTCGREYRSALDIPCREAYVQGSVRTRIAACQEKGRGWVLAPDILGDGAL